MSYVVLQIGQCGNQLGYTFYKTLEEIKLKKDSKNKDFIEDSCSRFLSYSETEGRHYAHAVLLDTEEKVINGIRLSTKSSSWGYKSHSHKVSSRGAGNNWAMGHYFHGPEFHDFMMDAVRKEIESCDQLQGFLYFGSVAGGSGSGLGSYISEVLRDEFPSVSSANISIWPFRSGEVAVQSYNAVLSLASIQNSSDAVFLFENDWLAKLCKTKMGLKSPTMWDLNYVASQQLLNLLLPCSSDSELNPNFNDLLGFLTPHPQFKLVGLRSVPQEPMSSLPFSSYTWVQLLRSLRRMLLYSTVIDEVYGRNNISTNRVTTTPISLSNLLVLRGRDCETADFNFLQKPSLPYASWVPSSSKIKIWTNPNSFLTYDRIAVLANNGQISASCVDIACARATRTYACHKFYFYHYEEYGLTEDDFKSSLMSTEQIVSSYKSLTV